MLNPFGAFRHPATPSGQLLYEKHPGNPAHQSSPFGMDAPRGGTGTARAYAAPPSTLPSTPPSGDEPPLCAAAAWAAS